MNSVESAVKSKLETLDPVHIEVINESDMHNVAAGSESHFKVILVSGLFEQKSLVDRHRIINELLQEELSSAVHALSLHTFTPDEWFEKAGETAPSPECLGGSKFDKK